MPNVEEKYGRHVKSFLNEFCYECGDTVSCAIGELSDDGTIEFRKCEEGHVVASLPSRYVPLSQATEFNIR